MRAAEAKSFSVFDWIGMVYVFFTGLSLLSFPSTIAPTMRFDIEAFGGQLPVMTKLFVFTDWLIPLFGLFTLGCIAAALGPARGAPLGRRRMLVGLGFFVAMGGAFLLVISYQAPVVGVLGDLARLD